MGYDVPYELQSLSRHGNIAPQLVVLVESNDKGPTPVVLIESNDSCRGGMTRKYAQDVPANFHCLQEWESQASIAAASVPFYHGMLDCLLSISNCHPGCGNQIWSITALFFHLCSECPFSAPKSSYCLPWSPFETPSTFPIGRAHI